MFYADRLGPRGGNRGGLGNTFILMLMIVFEPPPDFMGGINPIVAKLKPHPSHFATTKPSKTQQNPAKPSTQHPAKPSTQNPAPAPMLRART